MDETLGIRLSRVKLYDQIADQIEGLINDESLSPGDRLPSERQLADRLGVSRTVVREATRMLSVRGLVDVRPGSGTHVTPPNADNASATIARMIRSRHSSATFEHLNEIRRTLEVKIAELAALRRTDEDIAAMEAVVNGMEGHIDDADRFVQLDLDFHSALAIATHNELFSLLLSPVSDLLLVFRLVAYSHDAPSSIEGGLRFHSAILERVKQRDAEGAGRAMNAHLDQAEMILKAARVIGV